MRAVFASILGLAVILNGCAADSEPRYRAPAPLRFTAAQPVELSQWWTNGRAILHLRAEGGYDLYPALNRYESPRERGQWSKRSYVALEFEPYAMLNRRVERVQIDRDSEGELVLILRNELPFVPIDGPPEVLEDSLFGSWQGDDYLLTLDRNMRYRFRRLGAPVSGSPAAVSGHEGSWSMRGISEIILLPDAPGLAPIILSVGDSDGITIEDAERLSVIR